MLFLHNNYGVYFYITNFSLCWKSSNVNESQKFCKMDKHRV